MPRLLLMLATALIAMASLAPSSPALASHDPDEPLCDKSDQPPLPRPGTPGASSFWQAYREPLPPAPVFDAPGPKRVGLQAGHWRVEEVPSELRGLGHGAVGGGRAEWEVNLDIARRTAAILEHYGVAADVLPATIPVNYHAHAFVSIHADGDPTGTLRGFKLARGVMSATPEADDRLKDTLYEAYEGATGLPRDPNISRRMTAYYVFNSRRYCHALAPGTPGVILEAGFLTSAADRELLIGRPDVAARGIAEGLVRYLGLAQSSVRPVPAGVATRRPAGAREPLPEAGWFGLRVGEKTPILG